MNRWRIALATLFVVAAAAAASIYSVTVSKRYEATARVVVHPIPVADKTYTGVDVLHATGDTPRDLGTAAHFFDTPEVISTTATRLSLRPSQLSRSLDVHPLAGSNILLVVGKSASAQEAAQIANGVVQEAISQRTARVQAQVSAIINKLQSSTSPEAQRRVVDLQTLQGRSDPTLETLSTATAPTKASWPKPPLIISIVTLAALALAALFLALPRLLALRRKTLHLDVGDREQALRRRAAAIDQRQRDLEQVVVVAKDATSVERERLDARLAAVAAREQATAKQAAQVAQRERELAEQRAELEQPPPEPPPPLAPEPEPEPEEARSFEVLEGSEKGAEPLPASEAQPFEVLGGSEKEAEPLPVPEAEPAEPAEPIRPGGWTIQALEQLVAERGDSFPDKVEEWRYYILFLGEHADQKGALPASFDYLVEDTFGDLL